MKTKSLQKRKKVYLVQSTAKRMNVSTDVLNRDVRQILVILCFAQQRRE